MTFNRPKNYLVRRVSFSDIQLLRYWRNKEFVRNQMISKDLISFDNQIDWFQQLTEKNHLFIYSNDNTDIGFMGCNIVNEKNFIFDIGIYCGNQDYLGHPFNFFSFLFIHDYAFITLNLKKSIILISKKNKSALNINKKLGYEFFKETQEFNYYSLECQKYLDERKKFEAIFRIDDK